MAGVAVGILDGLLGVGGGTLSTPVLSLFSFPIGRAIGAGSLFNLIVALPAMVAFAAIGWRTSGRPADAMGHVACSAWRRSPCLRSLSRLWPPTGRPAHPSCYCVGRWPFACAPFRSAC
jgi:hypothetical protein